MKITSLLEKIEDRFDELECELEQQQDRNGILEQDLLEKEDEIQSLKNELYYLMQASVSSGVSLPTCGHFVDLNEFSPADDPQRGLYCSEWD